MSGSWPHVRQSLATLEVLSGGNRVKKPLREKNLSHFTDIVVSLPQPACWLFPLLGYQATEATVIDSCQRGDVTMQSCTQNSRTVEKISRKHAKKEDLLYAENGDHVSKNKKSTAFQKVYKTMVSFVEISRTTSYLPK